MPIEVKYDVGKKGENKGKEFVNVMVPGTGWRGLPPEIVRTVLAHANELRIIVSKTDAELLAQAKRQAAIKAAQALYSNAGDLGLTNAASANAAQDAMTQPPVNVIQAAQGVPQDAINNAMLTAIKDIAGQLKELQSFTQAAK